MGRVRTLRLPEGIDLEVDIYLRENGIKFTDLVISGIAEILYGKGVPVFVGASIPPIKAILPDEPVERGVIKEVEGVPRVLLEAVAKKVGAGGFFRPCPKEYKKK